MPLSKLKTLADLIEVHEKYYPNEHYHTFLMKVLAKTGKVVYKDENWYVESGYLMSENGRSQHVSDPGQLIKKLGINTEFVEFKMSEQEIYTNSEYIKLDAFRE